MPSIEDILNERGKTHGDFSRQSECSQKIKKLMVQYGYDNLPPIQREALDMIAHKLSRILVGDSLVSDHWDDIAGYAKLPVRFNHGLPKRGTPPRPVAQTLDEALGGQ